MINPLTGRPETESELEARYERERYEHRVRFYAPFADESRLARYNADFGNFWFTPDSKRFFSSRIGMIFHGRSPADWNIFITSEQNTWGNFPRRYTVRQLQIDGSVATLSEFQQYKTRAAAVRAVERYLENGTPFLPVKE